MTQEKRYINKSKQVKALILICIAVIVLLCACKSEKHTHDLTIVTGVKATCTEAGIEDYYSCSGCDALFADANGKERIDSPKGIDATGHMYGNWTVKTSPSREEKGEICAACQYCNDQKTAEIPAVSAANGYTLVSFGKNSVWTYSFEDNTIEIQLDENVETYSFAVADNDPFSECKGTVTDGGAYADGSMVGKKENKRGIFYQKTKGATFTTRITVSEATDAAFIIRVCSTGGNTFAYDQAVTSVLLNDKTDGVIRHTGTVTTNGWDVSASAEISVATLSLEEGENVLSFTMGADTAQDLNVAIIEFVSKAPVELAPAKHTVKTDAAVKASCVMDGLTKGKHCSACNKVLVKQNTIPSLGGHEWNGTICEICNAVKFEAETAALDTDNTKVGVGLEKDLETCNFPSGDAFVWNIEKADNCSLTFYVHASEDTTAVLSYCLGLSKRTKASDLFHITVNGEKCAYKDPVVIIPRYNDAGVTRYYGWSEYEVATISLKKGDNVVVLTKNKAGLNFDYIALKSTATLQDSREVANQGHNYSGWTVLSSPTYEADGEIGAYCEYCRDHVTTKIPAVSVENGYTKIKSAPMSVWNYSYSGEQIEILVQEETAIYSFTVADNDPFEDCKGTVTDGGIYTDGSIVEKISNHRGTFYQKTKGATFTTTITVPEATDVVFSVRVCGVKGVTTDYAQAIQSVLLNGQTDGVVLNNGTVKTNGWDVASASEISIATLSLKEGENTITFTMGSETETDLNVTSIEFITCVSVGTVNKHTPVVDAAVEPTCVAAGFTEGSHCSVCGHIIVEQEEIPMVSHVDLQPIDNACDVCGAEGNVYVFWVADNDPFADSNGGSVSGDAVNKYTNNRGTAYQQTQGATFSTTVNVSEKTGIKFAVKIVGNIGEHPVTDIFSSVKLGDRELTIDNGTANLNSWNVIEAADVFVVSMILEKGIHTISFTMGNLNVNVAGILVTSFVPVECAGS